MKTVQQLIGMIETEKMNLEKSRKINHITAIKKAIKNIDYYKSILLYLERNPTEEYLLKEKDRLQKIIASKTNMFHYWRKHIGFELEEKKQVSTFNKENNITYMRKQIKNINFILNS